MATIRKRGSSWHVQVRRSGQPTITRSFKKKPDADAWARQTEAQIDRRGLAPCRSDLEHITVGDLMRRYRDEVVVHKRSKKVEDTSSASSCDTRWPTTPWLISHPKCSEHSGMNA